MPKVRLQRARVGALVCQDKAGRVAQHVRMEPEADLGGDTGALDQLGEADAPLSETKMKADLASRFSTFQVLDRVVTRPSWELSRASLNRDGAGAAFGHLRARCRVNDCRSASGPAEERPRSPAESTVERADNLANLGSRQ